MGSRLFTASADQILPGYAGKVLKDTCSRKFSLMISDLPNEPHNLEES